jgi:molecular chaperone GrpE
MNKPNDIQQPTDTDMDPGDTVPSSRGRRGKTRAEERIDALDGSQDAIFEQVAELQARAETAEAETESIRSQWQRTAADFANYKRRAEEDRFRELGLASEGLLRRVLGVSDDLVRALEHVPPDQQDSAWAEGVAAIERKLGALLVAEGVSPIEAVGTPFDPRQHEAVGMEPTDEVPEGTVTRELQRGYQLRDRVLRPALVMVATST